MLVEIDQFVVAKDLWDKALGGDMDARAQVEKQLDGLELYMHALSLPDPAADYVVLTLHDLEALNIVRSIRVNVNS